MADFTSVQKYLERFKSRKASLAEAQNAIVPFDKYYGLVRSRDIKRIPSIIYIPAFYYDANVGNPSPRNPVCLLFQYNITTGYNFNIIKVEYQDPDLGWIRINQGDKAVFQDGLIAFKFRSGTTVSRYYFAGQNMHIPAAGQPAQEGLFFDNYTIQTIKSNFCLEFWLTTSVINIPTIRGIPNLLRITTSNLSVPEIPEEVEVSLQTVAPLTAATLGVALPEVLPYNQPDIAWLDN